MHGDAALSGQGVIQETLALSAVPHFNIGGSLHLAINNQVCIVYQCNYFVCLHHIFLLFFFLDATCSACTLSLGCVSHTAHYWCWQILFIVVAVMHDSCLVSPVVSPTIISCVLQSSSTNVTTPYTLSIYFTHKTLTSSPASTPQIGYTTPGERTRSTRYCTDVAKMCSMPVIHVNGDDPEVCPAAALWLKHNALNYTFVLYWKWFVIFRNILPIPALLVMYLM